MMPSIEGSRAAAPPAPLRVPVAAQHSRILGIGAYRPERAVSTAEIADRLGLDEQWMIKRSGIRSRRFAGAEESLPVMATRAAATALDQAGIDADRVGFVIVATTTHLTQMPALACDVAHRLGIRAAAFDLLAACAGFPYGLALGSDMVRAGTADCGIVIGAERMTDIVAEDDRSTAFLFADGAGAAVVGRDERPGIGPTVWGSDGSRADAVGMTGFWRPTLRAVETAWPRLGLTGWKVFRWAVTELAAVAREAVRSAGLRLEDIDVFVPHQANMLITEALTGQLGLRADVVVARDIERSGNTSSASIPLALDELTRSGTVRSGQRALFLGFGSGLAYAAQVVELP